MSANDVIVASTAADAGRSKPSRVITRNSRGAGRNPHRCDAVGRRARHRLPNRPAPRPWAFLTGELLPRTPPPKRERLYLAATRTNRARPLVESMIAVHRIIGSLVERIRTSHPRAAGSGRALQVLFDAPDRRNDRILPSGRRSRGLAARRGPRDARTAFGGHQPGAAPVYAPAAAASTTATIRCSTSARCRIRSARHRGVRRFDAVPVGGTLVLVAHQTRFRCCTNSTSAPRAGSRCGVMSRRGPEAWRLRLTKR